MAFIQETVQLVAPDDPLQKWTQLEERTRFLDGFKEIVGEDGTRLRWRKEVLTFAPSGELTHVTLRIDYDAVGPRETIREILGSTARRLRGTLRWVKANVESAEAGARGWMFTMGDPPRA